MKERYKISDIEKELKRIIRTKSYTLRLFCRPPRKLPKSFYSDMKRYFDENRDYKNFDKEKFYYIVYHYCKYILGIYPKKSNNYKRII